MSGKLYIVATPIGNLGDISPRAIETLQSVALIAAEDTRHSGRLLSHLQIDTPMLAVHDHNERDRAPPMIEQLSAGKDIALISDAGTPLISDPGFRLVRAARDARIEVVAIPGPSALIAALSIAGIATDRFCFEGFLPNRQKARRDTLTKLADEHRTMVFYESSHRLRDCLQDLADAFGRSRRVAIAKELTKRFERVVDGTIANVIAAFESNPNWIAGEFVIVVAGNLDRDAPSLDGLTLARALAQEIPPAQAAKVAAKLSGTPRKVLYEALSKDR